LELYYKTGDKDFIAQWDKFEDLPPEYKEFNKTKANGIALCSEYINHYHKLDGDMEIIEVEVLDRTKITDSLAWLVKIDTIVKVNGNLYVLEHKTTKKISPTYFNQFNPNMQVSGYTHYVAKKYGQCSGVIINALEAGFRQKAYKGEPAGFHCAFQRDIINRDSQQLKDFENNIQIGAEKLLEYSQCKELIFKNESACHQFRGCQFKEVCLTSVGTKLDDQIVDVLYDKVDAKDYLKKEGGEPNGIEEGVLST
jgi:hypothetical protein